MPRKKTVDSQPIEQVDEAGHAFENEAVQPLSQEFARAALQRAHDMVEFMNQQHWALNSTAIKQNLLDLIQYGLDYVTEQG